jgi:hypothetical protein
MNGTPHGFFNDRLADAELVGSPDVGDCWTAATRE